MVLAERRTVNVPASRPLENSDIHVDVGCGAFLVGLGVAAFVGSIALGAVGIAPLGWAVAGAGLSLADIALQYKGFLEPALKERSKRR